MKTKQEFENYLNGFDVPEDDKESNGGRVQDHAKYGSWLRRHDPIAFEVGYQDFQDY